MADIGDHLQTPRVNIEKVTRLLQYLLQLASLRSKLVRTVDEYEEVLWNATIPHEHGCFTQAWGHDEDHAQDIWLEVQHAHEPDLPAFPASCEDWVDYSTIHGKENVPELRKEIDRQVPDSKWHEESGDERKQITIRENLAAHPSVQAAWHRYVEQEWLPWTDKHNAWEKVNKVYSKLFAIHQSQLRLGEEYELVLGVGLLSWQTPAGQRVKRHLVVADASLEFEPRLARFTVRPRADGAKLRPELDMLDIQEQPAGAEQTAKIGLSAADDDPWDKGCVEGVLQALVHSINSQGEYIGSTAAKDTITTKKPVVEFAPALILRKRSSKGLIESLRRINKQIEDGGPIPDEFADLAEARSQVEAGEPATPDVSPAGAEPEVFFPKPSNNEQRQIVDKIRIANGVLVQGPPGTGKSHTIANLICHLLATGQRILVTAKTPRALQVLENLLPEEIQPLCINLLGSGLEERQALESSVGGILRKHGRWSEPDAARTRTELEQRLSSLREEHATVTRRLRDIRESEIHTQSVADGTYKGTAARIAEGMNRDRALYDWFSDVTPEDRTCPVSAEDLLHVLDTLREFGPDKRAELALSSPNEVPAAERFTELVNNEANAIKEEQDSMRGADAQIAAALARNAPASIGQIHAACVAFRAARSNLPIATQPWVQDAVRDVTVGTAGPWRELLGATQGAISSVERIVSVADDVQLQVPDDIDLRRLHDDARELEQHLGAGHGLGWGPFRSKLVRDRRYLLQKVTVNGRTCSTSAQFSTLGDALEVRIAFERAWRFWVGRHDRADGPYRLQLAALKSLRDTLIGALAIGERVSDCREAIKRCMGVIEPMWADESRVQCLIASCRLALARLHARLATEQIQEVVASVSKGASETNAHPVAAQLIAAIGDRSVAEYQRSARVVQQLAAQRQRVSSADKRLSELQRTAPQLAENMRRSAADGQWDARLRHIDDAWHWSQARYWVEQYIRKEDAPALETRTQQIEQGISDTLAQLASLRAWSFCFSRLGEREQRHMAAWQQSMRQLGKGTGKHAWRHRRDAQAHLNACRDAVPAWVMPLHRVWDTVDPEPSMFDVIIVDEASQCGPEALPLFYLAKKILIVGDDKQISPEAVGLDRGVVAKLGDQFLSDFEFRSVFGVESSLFDQGKLRYVTHQITLREHFRCMPEIIRFSNDLCYRDTPLIPLRQYGPDRLPPLEHILVEGGHREGSNSHAINRPEADAIADRICEMCDDDQYSGKTMGVVVLQGQAQAGQIECRLLKRLGAEEVERRRLVCGDAYSFQGDERDIIFLSLVAAPNATIGPLTKESDKRRFNVAASRARDMMILYHSTDCNDLSVHDLRRTLLEFFQNTKPQQIAGIVRDELERHAAQDNRGVVSAPEPFESWFEVDVALVLLRRQYTVLPQFEVAGRRIDLVVEGGNARLAVECDGDHWHGADRYDDDMQRQRQLERCGWEFFRVRESAFYANKDQALERLWTMLDERGIRQNTCGDEIPDNGDTGTEGDNEQTGGISDLSEDGHNDFDLDSGEDGTAAPRHGIEEIPANEIEGAIIRVLSRCPNNTCTINSITARVLKQIGVLTRGRPHELFEHRTIRCVLNLERNGQIEIYKSKNKRLRLIRQDQQ